MIISAKVIRKPESRVYCATCNQIIRGAHLRLFGAAERYDRPYVLRQCMPCAGHSKEPKIIRARLDAKRAEA